MRAASPGAVRAPTANAVGVPIDVVFRITLRRLPRSRHGPVGQRAADDRLSTGSRGPTASTWSTRRRSCGRSRGSPPTSAIRVHLRPALRSLAAVPAQRGDRVHHRDRTGRRAAAPDPALRATCRRSSRRSAPAAATATTADGGCLAAPAGGLSLCAAEAWAALVDVPHPPERPPACWWSPAIRPAATCCASCCPRHPDGRPPARRLGHRDPPGEPLPGRAAPDRRLDRRRREALAIRSEPSTSGSCR